MSDPYAATPKEKRVADPVPRPRRDHSAVPVVWVSWHDGIASRGYWDQALLEDVLSGEGSWRAARLPIFDHHRTFSTVPEGSGAVVVVPARWHVEDVEKLNEKVAGLPWCVLFLTGDEESTFPVEKIRHQNAVIWVQTPSPGVIYDSRVRFLGDGYTPGFRKALRSVSTGQRPHAWFFAGQINNESRSELVGALDDRKRTRGDGWSRVTRVFGSGLDQEEYASGMASAKVVPCPSGTFSPDTFRFFEALEAGCLPIVEERAWDGLPGYWDRFFGERPPVPSVGRWEEFDSVLNRELERWPGNANRAVTWWLDRKRELAESFVVALDSLGASLPEPSPDEEVTVLMPTSPIPSHPSLAIIDETIRSVRARLPRAPILVMVDGVREEQEDRRRDYDEYVRRLVWSANHEWKNVLPIIHDEHLHQAVMTRRALERVTTPTVLFVEHDTPLVGDVDWASVVAAVKGPRANVVRFHHEASVLDPHRHLMLDSVPQVVEGAPLLRTIQWSQRPHLAKTEFYRWMTGKFFGERSRTMIEDVMHGVVSAWFKENGLEGWRAFSLWMYAPDGDMKRSTHLDGREGDPKFGMRYAYDQKDTPLGAPHEARDEPAVVEVKVEPAPRLGIFGARADRRGLAIQLTEAARHLNPVKVFGVDMDRLSPYACDWSDYDPASLMVRHHDAIRPDEVRAWLQDLDVVFGAETFYVPWFTALCEQEGVKTVLQYNPEFVSHVLDWKPVPTVLANPTTWLIDSVPQARLLPLGVDRSRLPFRLRTEARTFLHVIGHSAAQDRQGTRVVWEALKRVTVPIRVIVRSMRGFSVPEMRSPVELDLRSEDVENYWDLYSEGDVLLHPRRYGGQSLPMNEALSCGMPVLMTNAEPQRSMLPEEMLIPAANHRRMRSLIGELPLYDADPFALAARIDRLASNPDEVEKLSKIADEIAETVSWTTLAPRYEELFRSMP